MPISQEERDALAQEHFQKPEWNMRSRKQKQFCTGKYVAQMRASGTPPSGTAKATTDK